ncbi:TetR/AcrR family transcriptional regulator [Deinococcus hopiensis]|uniref:Transcriptional regulator, TetR family n=1 Tax=Deinococcus hopiensis KR-140 TaxID=695939 RepID=A0A1W1VN73_9DEIO|nr:TetR/AcrR family transcriptional regulator [Deinococcus hopiensis]SMB94733.1 transcriptional regulator, TetR family [Deinococcus hopiensis KR-140]
MPRPAPHRDDTRSQTIRQAARTLFLRQGFAATTLDQVAAEASVSKATIYTRYRQKEELLQGVLDDFLRDWAAPPSGSPAAATIGDLRTGLQVLAEQAAAQLMRPEGLALVRMLIAEMNTQPELGELFVRTVPGPLLERVGALLASAQAAGLVRPAEPELAARAFVGPLMSFVMLGGLLAREPHPPTPQQLAAMVDLCLHGLLHFPAFHPAQEEPS